MQKTGNVRWRYNYGIGFVRLNIFDGRLLCEQINYQRSEKWTRVGVTEIFLTPYSGIKNPCFSHQLYQAASTYFGLYASGNASDMSFFSPSAVFAV